MSLPELKLDLTDNEWPLDYIDHDRQIVRAIVVDEDEMFYFVRIRRVDEFGDASYIETSGGGVEPGEDLHTAIARELREELGVTAEVLGKLGVVSDYYNLIHRHNINHYFLCRVTGFGQRHLTQEEQEIYHLSTVKLTWEEALREYEAGRSSGLGRLIANREVPILRQAKVLLDTLFHPQNL